MSGMPPNPPPPARATHAPQSSQAQAQAQAQGAAPQRNTRQTRAAAPRRRRKWSTYPKKRLGWLSRKLRWPMVVFVVLLQLGIAAAILALLIISNRNSGFVQVPAPPAQVAGTDPAGLATISLLWSALPPLLLTFYKSLWQSILDELKKRQPFVELKRTNGASAKKTVLLDYDGTSSALVWASMLRNGHWLLGTAGLLGLATALFLVPFSAYLFQAAPVLSQLPISAFITSDFDTSQLSLTTDFVSIFDNVTISLIDGAPYPLWTTANVSVPGVTVPTQGQDRFATSYSASVTAWAGQLDCVIISNSAVNYSASDTKATVTYTDRNCSVQQDVPVTPYQNVSMYGWTTDTCAGSANYSRISILSSSYTNADTADITDFSLISCIPVYLRIPGTMTVQIPNGSTSFQPGGSNVEQIDMHGPWLDMDLRLFQDQIDSPFSNFSGSDFTGTIYAFAESRAASSGADPLSASSIRDATTAVFGCFCAMLGSAVLRLNFEASDRQPVFATIAAMPQRLFVISQVAVTSIVILCLSAIVTLCIGWYSNSRPSSLHEEPSGLLSYAGMLKNSPHIDQLLEQLGQRTSQQAVQQAGQQAGQQRWDGKLHKRVKKSKVFSKPSWKGNWAMVGSGADEHLEYIP